MAALLRPGDVVSVHIKEAQIVSSYSGFDSSEPFQIIATDDEGYYLYIPPHIIIADAFVLDAYRANVLNIKKQFIDSNVVYITPSYIASIRSRLDGTICTKCGEFFDMASGNQPDGSFICFICRSYWWFVPDS